MIKESVNTFSEGVNFDLNPIVTPKNTLTDNINGTFITFNGDELALQNDAGNAKISKIISLGTRNEIPYGAIYNYYFNLDKTFGNIAADGWSIPSIDDFNTLITFAMSNGGLSALCAPGPDYWPSYMLATNSLGFNARGTGSRATNISGQQHLGLFMWDTDYLILLTSTNTVNGTYRKWLNPNYNANSLEGENAGSYIRLIKDETTLSHGETGTYIGNDGKVYPTICIGTQEWLATNLSETLMRDLTPIPIVTDNAAWAALTTPAMCYYNNITSHNSSQILQIEEFEEQIVQLSEGFYPLGIKEHGGILYIVSGKDPDLVVFEWSELYSFDEGEVSYKVIDGINYYYESLIDDNIEPLPVHTNEYWLYIGTENDFKNRYGKVEFGSYPSPEVVDATLKDTSLDYSLENYEGANPDEVKSMLYSPKVINNELFRAGVYIQFNPIPDLLTDYISYPVFRRNSATQKMYKSKSESVRLNYKVKLYQQLSNGIIDLTDDVWLKYASYWYDTFGQELNTIIGIVRFWFNDPNFKYYCPHNFKGKLMLSVELEEYDDFSLVYSNVLFDGTNYTINFDLNVEHDTAWDNMNSNAVYIAYTLDGSEPNFNTITVSNKIIYRNISSTGILLGLSDAGKNLKYKIRPALSTSMSSSAEYSYFPQEFLNKHTVSGEMIVVSDVEDYKIVIDESSYILDPLGTNARIITRLTLTNSIGNYIDNEFNLSMTPYQFYLSGTAAPTNSLGTYVLGGSDLKADFNSFDVGNPITPDYYEPYIESLVNDTVIYIPFENWGLVDLSVTVNKTFGVNNPIKVIQGSQIIPYNTVGTTRYYKVEAGIPFTIKANDSIPSLGLDLNSDYDLNTTIINDSSINFGLITKLEMSQNEDDYNPGQFSDHIYIPMNSLYFGTPIGSNRYTVIQTNPNYSPSNVTEVPIISGESTPLYWFTANGTNTPMYDITFTNITSNIYNNLTGLTLALEGSSNLFLTDYYDIQP